MIDLTLMPEVLNPLSVTQTAASKITTGQNKGLWIFVIGLIVIFGVFGYLAYRDEQKRRELINSY